MAEIKDRAFEWDSDIQPITQFLLDTYMHHQRLFNWDPRRWIGKVYHSNDANMAKDRAEMSKTVHLWEDEQNRIVGVVIPEYSGGAFLQIHPDHRHIESEMLTWTEANLTREEDGRQCLDVWAEERDTFRTDLLAKRGYTRGEEYETMRRRPMSEPIPDIAVPEGYRVRNMRRTPDDQQGLANLLNAAFKRTFHSAGEYRNFQTSPTYSEEFDIVVEAPDGTLAANAGFTVHEKESFALIEPVCTHPDHQGRGLARAAIAEGLRRAQALGLEAAFVGAWYSNPVANHVYQKMGFTDGVRLYLWRRCI